MASSVSRRALLSVLLAGSTAGCIGSLGDDSGDDGDSPDDGGSPDDGDAGSDSTAEVDGADVEQRIHELVNEERTARDLPSLSWNGQLQNVADAHTADMLVRDFVGHENPDGEGVGDRLETHGVTDCGAWGENIAETSWNTDVETDDGVERYTTVDGLATAIVEGWMNSEEHRANVLGEDWESEGVGVEIAGDGQVLATQTFCG